jgi:hypothetical protein
VRRIIWICAGLALLLAGCIEATPTVGPCATDTVQLTNREPGPACVPLGAAEAHSGEGADRDLTAYATLRSYARSVGANYVVLDAFAVASDEGWPTALRGRLFSCPLGAPCR